MHGRGGYRGGNNGGGPGGKKKGFSFLGGGETNRKPRVATRVSFNLKGGGEFRHET